MGRYLVTLCTAFACAAIAVSPAAARFAFDSGDAWVLATPKPAPAGTVVVHVRGTLALHDAPFGRIVDRVGSTTEFGSARALTVVRSRRGRWLGVETPELGNDRLAWIDARAGGVTYSHTRYEVDVDLGRHTLVVRNGSRVVRRAAVGIGRPDSPTPTGRFAITDKLAGPAYSAYYGCCILALNATQTRLPAGWSGGNRIAIHGTLSRSDFGHAVSAGCIHAPDADLRYLMRTLPLGTPVVIRR